MKRLYDVYLDKANQKNYVMYGNKRYYLTERQKSKSEEITFKDKVHLMIELDIDALSQTPIRFDSYNLEVKLK